jgi:hypothetical protein
LQVWELQGWNATGPVATITDNQHGFGSHDGSQFRFTGMN